MSFGNHRRAGLESPSGGRAARVSVGRAARAMPRIPWAPAPSIHERTGGSRYTLPETEGVRTCP